MRIGDPSSRVLEGGMVFGSFLGAGFPAKDLRPRNARMAARAEKRMVAMRVTTYAGGQVDSPCILKLPSPPLALQGRSGVQ